MNDEESSRGFRSAELIERIEDEILYVLRRRGRSELRFLLVLLDDEFPEARPIDLAQAVGNLIDQSRVEVCRCDHGDEHHLSCGCITLQRGVRDRFPEVSRDA